MKVQDVDFRNVRRDFVARYREWKQGVTEELLLPAMITAFEELNRLDLLTLTSPAFAPCHSGKKGPQQQFMESGSLGSILLQIRRRSVADQDWFVLGLVGGNAVAPLDEFRVEGNDVEQGPESQLFLDEPADRATLGPE